MNACLAAVTRYVNGMHCNNLWIVGCPATICKFQTIGVNQKNICITIFSNCEKSGINVVTAEVNLVNAMIKQYAANSAYNNISKLGKYPKNALTTIDIINKNIETNAEDIIDITGIVSTGNTTFFTR